MRFAQFSTTGSTTGSPPRITLTAIGAGLISRPAPSRLDGMANTTAAICTATMGVTELGLAEGARDVGRRARGPTYAGSHGCCLVSRSNDSETAASEAVSVQVRAAHWAVPTVRLPGPMR